MNPSPALPGNAQHQTVLTHILDFYADDSRIRAVVLFGSLGRGNWDDYSDLDLDIIMADEVAIDAEVELAKLCAGLQKTLGVPAIIIADQEEGDVVLENLLEFSIRYHPLDDTKPAILDTMQVLTGSLRREDILKAGEANQTRYGYTPNIAEMINQCLRYSLEIYNALQRQRLWMALELLHRARSLLMEVFTVTRGGFRTVHYVDQEAPAEFVEKLKRLTPTPTLPDVKIALTVLLDILENDLSTWSNHQYELTASQEKILAQMGHKIRQTGG